MSANPWSQCGRTRRSIGRNIYFPGGIATVVALAISGGAASVRADEPKADPAAPPQQPQPAAAPQNRVQIQVQAGGGRVQIQAGGAIQIQGNAQVQVAQFGVQGAAVSVGEANEVSENSAFRAPDRTLLQRLNNSETLAEEERYAEAVELLGSILEQPEDFFFRPDRDNSTSRSLKQEAQNRIGRLPPEGRDAYELQYGAKAGQMLAAAVAAGDEIGLAETSRRYFHTAAGLRATYLLGVMHLDHGRPLAAALCWKRLREVPAASEFEPELSLQLATAWSRAGVPESARELIDAASKRYPGAVLTLGGTPHRWPGGDQAMAWLATAAAAEPAGNGVERRAADEWLMAGGNATRNAVSPGSNPLLNRRWAVPYVNHPDVEKLAEQLSRGFEDQAGAPLPASQPLAVGDVILMRTLSGLTAVDFRTGKRIWRGVGDERLEQLLGRESPLSSREGQDASTLLTLLEQRLWHDGAYGTFSSDGERVFCIEEELPTVQNSSRTVIFANGRRMSPGLRSTVNRLVAYDLETEGKLLWEVGGPAADPESQMDETLFLGPPLPMADRLYVLAERRSEVRLLVLDAATGRVDWSQQLAMAPEQFNFGNRRTCGLSPSYADGVLVCPTSLGAVVGVDLFNRSLLWGFQYRQMGDNGQYNNRMFMWQMQAQQEAAEEDRWHEAVVTVADGRVLVSPSDGDQLHCLNLLDGSVVWQKPRDHGLYFGGVADGRALVVGVNEMRAHDLATGDVDWTVKFPEGAEPSGRGFYNGDHFFVPLSSAEVASIDVREGRIAARSRSRSGTVPGNLVCYRGAVLSQGIDGLECFCQLDDLRRDVIAKLQQDPNDADALASQGELLLNDGKTAAAIESLRKAFSGGDDPRTRNLLIDALLEGLGEGVATTAGDLAELERLAAGTVREETYLRLRAEAHEKAGDDRQAFAVYLRLVDLPSDNGEPLRASANLSVGREQRVKGKLQALFARANAEQRKAIDATIADRREAALNSGDAGVRQRFLDYFGQTSGADEVRLELALQAESAGNLLEAENLLRQAGDNEATAGRATARLAKLLIDAGRPGDAANYVARLESDFADKQVLDGKTGSELAASLIPAGRDKTEQKHVWPVGRVEVSDVRLVSGGNRTMALEFRGERGPYFAGQSVELDQSQMSVIGRDMQGAELWKVTLGDAQQRRIMNLNPSISHVRADGHLLLLSLGHEVVAIDVLGGGADKPARVLWRVDLTDSLPGMPGAQNVHPRVVQMPWGVPRFMAADGNGRPIGITGPVTARYASFLKQRALHVVDPLTGRVLWIRHDIDSGSDVFGDDEYIFVTPTNESQLTRTTSSGANVTTVYRASDGEKVKEVKLPRPEQRVTSYGRRLLTWSNEGGKMVLQLIDGFDESVAWSESFPNESQLWPIDGNEASVFTKAGRLTVLSLADGSKRLEASVMPEPQLTGSYVFRNDGGYVLVTNSPMKQKEGLNVQPVPGGFNNPLVNGYVYGFDAATGKQTYRTRVNGHGLTLTQPPDLPMLVFASQRFEQVRNQMRSPESVLFCVDKRNGRVLYDKTLSPPMSMVDLSADPEHDAVVLKTGRESKRFVFTNQPIDSPAAGGDKTPTKVEP